MKCYCSGLELSGWDCVPLARLLDTFFEAPCGPMVEPYPTQTHVLLISVISWLFFVFFFFGCYLWGHGSYFFSFLGTLQTLRTLITHFTVMLMMM